jgi:hypothetical protein
MALKNANSKYLIVVQEKIYNENGAATGTYGVERWPNFTNQPDDGNVPTNAAQYRDYIAVDYNSGSYNAPTSITADPNTDMICRRSVPSASTYDLTPSISQIGGSQDVMFLLNSQLVGGELVYGAPIVDPATGVLYAPLQDSLIYINSSQYINSYSIYIGYLSDREVKLIGSQPTKLDIGNLDHTNSYVTLSSDLHTMIDELNLLKNEALFSKMLKDYLKPINLTGIFLKEYADGQDTVDDSDIGNYWGVGCDTTQITLGIDAQASDEAAKTFCNISAGNLDSTISFNGETNAGKTRTITSQLTEVEAKVGSFFEQLFFGGLGRTYFHNIAYYTLKLVFKDSGNNTIVFTLPKVTVTPSTSFSNGNDNTKTVDINASQGNLSGGFIKYTDTVDTFNTTVGATGTVDSEDLLPQTSLPALVGDLIKDSHNTIVQVTANTNPSNLAVVTVAGVVTATTLAAKFMPGSATGETTTGFTITFTKGTDAAPLDINRTLLVQDRTPDPLTGNISYNYVNILDVDDKIFMGNATAVYDYDLKPGTYRVFNYNNKGQASPNDFTLTITSDQSPAHTDITSDWHTGATETEVEEEDEE